MSDCHPQVVCSAESASRRLPPLSSSAKPVRRLFVAAIKKRQNAAGVKMQSSPAQRLRTDEFCRQKSHRDRSATEYDCNAVFDKANPRRTNDDQSFSVVAIEKRQNAVSSSQQFLIA
jgi:hypothetical protein